MLSNAYFLAKFRFDTAENEPAINLQKFTKFANFANPNPLTITDSRSHHSPGDRRNVRLHPVEHDPGSRGLHVLPRAVRPRAEEEEDEEANGLMRSNLGTK